MALQHRTKSLSLQAPIASNPHYTLTAEFTENSIDTSSNTSSVTCKVTLAVDSTSSFTGTGNGVIKIYWYDNNKNGNGLLFSTLNIDSLSAGSSKYISATKNIEHKTDGTLKGKARAIWTKSSGNTAVPPSGTIYTTSDGTSSGTPYNLANIPRKSGISVSSGNQSIADNVILIDLDRKYVSYRDTIEWSCSNLSETIQTKGEDTKIALCFDDNATIPDGYVRKRSSYSNDDLMDLIPNAKTQTITFTTETFNGNTSLGSTSANFTYKVYQTPYQNVLSYSITDTLSQNLTGETDVVIKRISNVLVTNTPTKNSYFNDNCTITSYLFNSSATSDVVQNSNSYTFTGLAGSTIQSSATDSRGYSTEKTQGEITLDSSHFIEYELPTITKLTAERPESTSNTINLKIEGTFWNDDFGSVNNAMHLYYRYKENSGSYGSYVEITPTILLNNYSYTGTITISANNEATIEVMVVDSTNSSYLLTASVPKGASIFDIGDEYFNVNGVLAENGSRVKTLDNTYPVGSVYISSTNTNPATALGGGTWELFDKEFSCKKFSATDTDTWYTINTTNTTSATCYASRAGHCITIELSITNKVALTDSNFDLLTFDINKLGIKSGGEMGTAIFTAFCADGANGIAYGIIYGGGIVRTYDVMVRGSSTASLPVAGNLRGSGTWTIAYNQMDDSACDKFYWKRTA